MPTPPPPHPPPPPPELAEHLHSFRVEGGSGSMSPSFLTEDYDAVMLNDARCVMRIVSQCCRHFSARFESEWLECTHASVSGILPGSLLSALVLHAAVYAGTQLLHAVVACCCCMQLLHCCSMLLLHVVVHAVVARSCCMLFLHAVVACCCCMLAHSRQA